MFISANLGKNPIPCKNGAILLSVAEHANGNTIWHQVFIRSKKVAAGLQGIGKGDFVRLGFNGTTGYYVKLLRKAPAYA